MITAARHRTNPVKTDKRPTKITNFPVKCFSSISMSEHFSIVVISLVMCQLFRGGGVIVNLSTIGAVGPCECLAVYVASKVMKDLFTCTCT